MSATTADHAHIITIQQVGRDGLIQLIIKILEQCILSLQLLLV